MPHVTFEAEKKGLGDSPPNVATLPPDWPRQARRPAGPTEAVSPGRSAGCLTSSSKPRSKDWEIASQSSLGQPSTDLTEAVLPGLGYTSFDALPVLSQRGRRILEKRRAGCLKAMPEIVQ